MVTDLAETSTILPDTGAVSPEEASSESSLIKSPFLTEGLFFVETTVS